MNRANSSRHEPGEKAAQVSTWVYAPSSPPRPVSQWVVEERPVTLYVNDHEIVTLLCAGHHLDELAVGFFYAEGFIDGSEDIAQLDVDSEDGRVSLTTTSDVSWNASLFGKRTVTSGCGKGTLFYHALDALLSRPLDDGFQIPAVAIPRLVADLNRLSRTYRRTHGVHNCALAHPEEILVFRDDIGRHNAVDMLIGHSVLHGLSLEETLLITTGRLTSEILIKAAKVRIPVIVSRNTATTLAIRLARELNITLIGYARGGKFTLYHGKERLS